MSSADRRELLQPSKRVVNHPGPGTYKHNGRKTGRHFSRRNVFAVSGRACVMTIMKDISGTWGRTVKRWLNYSSCIFVLIARYVTLCMTFYLITILSSTTKGGSIAAAALPENNQSIVETTTDECPPYEFGQDSATRPYLRLAQSCQPPPQCDQNQRPCNIHHDENSCITWNCCEK